MCTRAFVLSLFTFLLAGCGGGESSSEPAQTTLSSDAGEQQPAGITAALTPPDPAVVAADGSRVGATSPAEPVDPIRRQLAEIQQIRINARPGSDPNRAIVLKATEVLKLTMQDPARQSEFMDGIRHLLQARLQLALTGSQQDIDQLYADVQALNDRDEQSAAAAEGIYYLARFAHTKARQLGREDTQWYAVFSRWAREFAQRFPQQSERALSLLFGAGRSCEMSAPLAADAEDSAMLRTEAKLCYSMLQERWPQESQGQEAAAVMRRLELPGKKLSQFSGPCLDDSQIRAEQLAGRPALIYFWDADNKQFLESWLPSFNTVTAKVNSDRLRFIGVNLDEDRQTCANAVQEHQLPGDQIFFDEEDRRGWNSPLVRFWGISQSPSVWLVDAAGVVDCVDLRQPELFSRLTALLKRRQTAGR